MVFSKKRTLSKFGILFLAIDHYRCPKFLTLLKIFVSLLEKFWFCPNIFLSLPKKFAFFPNFGNLGAIAPLPPPGTAISSSEQQKNRKVIFCEDFLKFPFRLFYILVYNKRKSLKFLIKHYFSRMEFSFSGHLFYQLTEIYHLFFLVDKCLLDSNNLKSMPVFANLL